jgi:sugar phosphate isomerase/epimerase
MTLTVRFVPMGFTERFFQALRAAGYTVPPAYEVAEFQRLGVPRCRVTVTVPLHPIHPDWFDLSFMYWGFRGHESVESAALQVLTKFCDHNLTVVALSPFGLFLAVCPHDPPCLDRVDQLQEIFLLAEPLDVTRTLTRCLDVLFTLQGLRYTTASVISQHLESPRLAWHSLSAAYQ